MNEEGRKRARKEATEDEYVRGRIRESAWKEAREGEEGSQGGSERGRKRARNKQRR